MRGCARGQPRGYPMSVASADTAAREGLSRRARGGVSSRGEAALAGTGSDYLYALILAMTICVFVIDLYTPPGVSEWVFYCIPLVISFLLWHPLIPPGLAVAMTLLAAIGNADLTFQNRGYGVVTFWVLAVTGYFFIRTKLSVKRQEWLHGSQVGLASAIAGDVSVAQLGERALKFLAERLGCNAGAIFVENGAAYRRSASYAIPGGAAVPEVIAPGDGLLGQAVKDGCRFHVHDVPDGYLYFGTALGRAKPR